MTQAPHVRLRIFLVTVAVFAVHRASAQTIWYVDRATTGTASGASWENAFTEVQSALSVAQPGDQVWVARGVYRPDYDPVTDTYTQEHTRTIQLVSGVALYGGFDGNETALAMRARLFEQTVLSCFYGEGSAWPRCSHVVTGSGTDRTAVLDGFTITGGCGEAGGGMMNDQGSPSVRNCTFTLNDANWSGGGMANVNASSPAVTGCTFLRNHSTAGGGIYIESNSVPIVTGCTFVDNIAFWDVGGYGGGIAIVEAGAIVANSTFYHNWCPVNGGAIWVVAGTLTVVNSTFVGNGVYRFYGGGGAIGIEEASAVLDNCTIAGNEGRGGIMVARGSLVVHNSVLWNNRDGDEPSQFVLEEDGLAEVTYSNVQSSWPGVGNIDVPPAFVRMPDDGGDGWGHIEDWEARANDDPGDLRLRADSPCIDAGDNEAVLADAPDLDGDGDTGEPIPFDLDAHPRIVDEPDVPDTGHPSFEYPDRIVDMSAFEYWMAGDCDGDRQVGLLDHVILHDCMRGPDRAVTSTCRHADLNHDGYVDDRDFAVLQCSFTGG